MKKTLFVVLISLLIVASVVLWWSHQKPDGNLFGAFPLVLLLIVGLALFFLYYRFSSLKRGEPVEDEMSKMIMLKTSSSTYYISLFWWLGLSYFSERIKMETDALINRGIIGMAVIFIICWIFYKIKGVKNA